LTRKQKAALLETKSVLNQNKEDAGRNG